MEWALTDTDGHGPFRAVSEGLAICWQDGIENRLNGNEVRVSSDPPTRQPNADPTRELALTVPLARDAFFRSVRARVRDAFDTLAGEPLKMFRYLVEKSPDDREDAESQDDREDAEGQLEARLDRWLERYNLFDSDGSGWCRKLARQVLALWCAEPLAAADRMIMFGQRHIGGLPGPNLSAVRQWPAFTGETPHAAGGRMKTQVAEIIDAWVADMTRALPALVVQEQWGFDMLALHQCKGLSQRAIVRLLTSEGHAVTPGRVSQEIARLEAFLCLKPRKRHSGGRPITL